MRIVSQLFPSGKPVSTDIEATRQQGITTWDIPAWGRPLALGIYPFFVTRGRHLLPKSTAFCISKLAISLTSLHNIRTAASNHWHTNSKRKTEDLPGYFSMKDLGMAIFHHQVLPGGALSGNVYCLDFLVGAHTTDVCCVFPQFQDKLSYLPLPLSFSMPRIGSRVICVGFENMSPPVRTLTFDDIQCGRINLLDVFEKKFVAVEGHVTRIFTQRFMDRFISGPCCTIDAETKPGMQGGPVFSDNGYVIGIVSAGATTFLNEPASIVSLLYPSLVMNIKFSRQNRHMRIDLNRRLIELIAQGAVITDGSENLITLHQDSNGFRLHLPVHEEDAYGTYDDFSGYQEGRLSTRESREVYRFGQ